MNNCKTAGRFLAAIFVLGTGSLWADVKMPAIFGDHMVLQQDITLPVWGTADPGEKVTVKIGNSSGSATAGADGKWMVKLPPLPPGSAPLTMTVAGKNTLTFQDVLPGDVWVCSGQSNMQFALGSAHNFGAISSQLNDPQLRLFAVPLKTATEPQTDTPGGKWVLCAQDTASRFSAVGYFFGTELRKHFNRPIGLIGTYWGGTPAQAWTSLSALQADPALKGYVDQHDKIVADFPQATADYPAKMAAYNADKAKWDQEVGTAYNATLKDWTDAVAKAKADDQPAPPKPQPTTPAPRPPTGPDGGPNAPTNLFNAMIAPLIPYGIKGAIWYQGEANTGQAVLYRTLFGDMITDWRTRWGEGNFTFLFVQLARFQAPNPNFAELRNSQLKTLELPNTGMATAFDIGNQTDIHPKDKVDVGQRLALAARHVAYGEEIVYSGPIFDKVTIEGNKARVSFTQTGSGLIIGSAPWVPDGAQAIPTTSLVGFTVAGTDGKWAPADATIDGKTVVVTCKDVPQPVSVRYAFEGAVGNLYNKENLPAIPFRSDKGMEATPAPAAAAPAPAPTTTPPPVAK
jgi:sialate O-acetylesterase